MSLVASLRAFWGRLDVPREFAFGEVGPVELAEVVCVVAASTVRPPAAPTPPPPAVVERVVEKIVEKPVTTPDVGLLVAVCGGLSRIRTNWQSMVTAGPDRKELRMISRAVDQLEKSLKERGVEYFTKTGQPFDAGDSEFEPRGQPVAVPGISRSRIGPCECPLVKLNGKVVQRAQGLVEVPGEKGV